MHLNTSGLNIPAKRERLFTLAAGEDADVAVFTETWLSTQVDISTEQYRVFRTPPGRHQGVAIALRKAKFEFAKLLHPDLHTVHTMALKTQSYSTAQGRRQQLIVIGHYSQTQAKEQCQQELQFFVANLRREHPNVPLVLAGDLNIQGEEAREAIRGLNLIQAKPTSPDTFFSLRQENGHRSWVDHIAVSEQLTTLNNVTEANFPSDHVPITTRVAIPHLACNQGQERRQIQHVLQRDLTDQQVQRILKNTQWP